MTRTSIAFEQIALPSKSAPAAGLTRPAPFGCRRWLKKGGEATHQARFVIGPSLRSTAACGASGRCPTLHAVILASVPSWIADARYA